MTGLAAVRKPLAGLLKGLVVGAVLVVPFQDYVEGILPPPGSLVIFSEPTVSVLWVTLKLVPLLFAGQAAVGIAAAYVLGGRSGLVGYLLCVLVALFYFSHAQFLMGHLVGGAVVLLVAALLRGRTGRTFSDRSGVRMQGRS